MNTLKWLFAVTTMIAAAVTGYLYYRECEVNDALRKRFSAGKAILNEQFIKSLIANDKLVGSLEGDRDFFAGTCDVVITDASTLRDFTRRPPASQHTSTLFPAFSTGSGDRGYLYTIPERIPPGFMEGEFLSGYIVISHDSVIIGIYPIYTTWDA